MKTLLKAMWITTILCGTIVAAYYATPHIPAFVGLIMVVFSAVLTFVLIEFDWESSRTIVSLVLSAIVIVFFTGVCVIGEMLAK